MTNCIPLVASLLLESSYKSLLSYSLSHHKNFNDINWATSFSSLGRLHRRTDRSVRKDGEGDVLKLMKRLEERIEREVRLVAVASLQPEL
jgi:hypothetical protein